MKRLFSFATALLSLWLAGGAIAQQVPVGQWRDELPYTLINSITEAGNGIYASTPYAVFYFDKSDNSVTRITKISGLSDIGISCIRYNPEYKTLVIAYSNANIDLVRNNAVINISDIKRKPILGNKTINHIHFIGQNAYLSCGFGIVALDIVREEIRDTYYIGKNGSQVNVLSLTMDDKDTLYAATEKGLYRAWQKDPNLSNFAVWRKDTRIDTAARYNSIAWFAGQVIVNKKVTSVSTDTMLIYRNGTWQRFAEEMHNEIMQINASDKYLVVAYKYYVKTFKPDLSFYSNVPGPIYPLTAIADRDGLFWAGDNYLGLNSYNPVTGAVNPVTLSGPSTALAFSMTARGNDLYIAPGGRDGTFAPIYYQPQVYHYNHSEWVNILPFDNPVMNGTHDVVSIAVDPTDPARIYAATFGKGLLEIYRDSVVRRYTRGNSTLYNYSGSDTNDIRLGGVAFDPSGNLWAVCSHTNNCLSMKKGDTWKSFSVPIEFDLGQLLIDRHGTKWVQMRYGTMNSNSLLVFTENGTPDNPADDQFRLLNSAPGNGNIPGTTVLALAEDRNGEIWVGTEKGIGVFYTPENIFSGVNADAQQILVTQGSYVQYLLENETVTAIAVDGANQKWIGTDRGGVFLFSPDGTREIFHFTAENSPLLSNRITCIAITDEGTVYFGTDNGVISLRGSATPPAENGSGIFVFPNPVREDYEGCIAVRGLMENAQVRITGIDGALVFAGKAGSTDNSYCDNLSSAQSGVKGGQIVWDGRTFDGRKVRSGVYLVWAADDTGNDKVVGRILIVR